MYSIKILGQGDTAVRFKILENESSISFQKVFKLWEKEPEFIDFYANSLKDFGFKAFFWEHPGLTENTISKPYECILQKSKTLDSRTINEQAFSDYLNSSNGAEDFLNLGKNARLVIPTKQSNSEIYKHFGSFIFNAENAQIQAFFQKVGTIVQREIEEKPMIWLNTAGMGVIWLHVRMDTKPKYYKTKNYKRVDFFN
jgi:hypothetical protein